MDIQRRSFYLPIKQRYSLVNNHGYRVHPIDSGCRLSQCNYPRRSQAYITKHNVINVHRGPQLPGTINLEGQPVVIGRPVMHIIPTVGSYNTIKLNVSTPAYSFTMKFLYKYYRQVSDVIINKAVNENAPGKKKVKIQLSNSYYKNYDVYISYEGLAEALSEMPSVYNVNYEKDGKEIPLDTIKTELEKHKGTGEDYTPTVRTIVQNVHRPIYRRWFY